jgi:hypothetical protein
MSNIQITELGIIKGGNCEKMFKNRNQREKGTADAVNWLLHNDCMNIFKGWCQIVKFPKRLQNMRWVIRQCSGKPTDYELGWRRFMSDIALPLYRSKKKFRLSQLKKWGADLAALEFVLTKLSYSKPHCPEIYKIWNKA